MSGVYLGRGSAPSDGTGIGSVITQHVGIHLLLQLIAGGKAAVRNNFYKAQGTAPIRTSGEHFS